MNRSSRLSTVLTLIVVASALLLPTPCLAADQEVSLTIAGHQFEPAELKVPAGQRVRLTIHNRDSTPEEFESHSLNREKVIPGGGNATVYIGPLKPGRYEFIGEFNPKTARGVVIAD